MNTRVIKSKLCSQLKDKHYRNLFISSELKRTIPFQLRALRLARNKMTQADLAKAAETKQSVISRIENKGAINLSIKTLLKLAEALDVALIVRFEPIDKLLDWVDELSPEALSPKASEEIILELEKEAAEVKKSLFYWGTSRESTALQNTGTTQKGELVIFPSRVMPQIVSEVSEVTGNTEQRSGIFTPIQFVPKPQELAPVESQSVGAFSTTLSQYGHFWKVG